MFIKGIQKVTLLDYPGKVACTFFTAGCNMRCPFCQNASLVTHIDEERIAEEEALDFLKERVGKLDAVCISGGEPCVQPDLKSFLRKVKELGFLIKLDTNGSKPLVVQELVHEGLIDYVAMDVKNVWEKYSLTSGSTGFVDEIKQTITFLKESGLPHEFRTTVVREFHTKEDLVSLAKILAPSNFYLQQFRLSDDVINPDLHAYEKEEMQEILDACQQVSSHVFLRGI